MRGVSASPRLNRERVKEKAMRVLVKEKLHSLSLLVPHAENAEGSPGCRRYRGQMSKADILDKVIEYVTKLQNELKKRGA